jgi:type I restriction enzyme S subunit
MIFNEDSRVKIPALLHFTRLGYVDLANTKNGLILETTDYKWADSPSRARRKLRAGDTIVGTVRPGNRSYCLVPQSDQPLTGSTGFAVLTPTKECYREFNFLSLTSTTNINRLTTLASGAAYPAVNPDVVAGYEIPFPPEALVDRFHAQVKDSFDLIQVNQKQNQELTQLRDWLLPMLMNGQVTVAD